MDRIISKVQFHTFLAIFDRFNFDQVWPALSCLAFYNNVLSVLHILCSSILISYSVLFMFFMIVIRLRVKMWILSRFPRSASLSLFLLCLGYFEVEWLPLRIGQKNVFMKWWEEDKSESLTGIFQIHHGENRICFSFQR